MSSTLRALPFVLGVGVVLGALPAFAEGSERFDHRGSLGVILQGGAGFKDGLGPIVDDGVRIPIDVGATMAVGYAGNELVAEGLCTFLGKKPVDWGAAFGFRDYFGEERVKTYVSLELAAHVTPYFTIGPRVSLGVEYEVASTVGLLAGITADVGGGVGFRFSAEGFVGVQVRSYLLE